jgi:hypothetical protein
VVGKFNLKISFTNLLLLQDYLSYRMVNKVNLPTVTGLSVLNCKYVLTRYLIFNKSIVLVSLYSYFNKIIFRVQMANGKYDFSFNFLVIVIDMLCVLLVFYLA